jgi:hypothetical protein
MKKIIIRKFRRFSFSYYSLKSKDEKLLSPKANLKRFSSVEGLKKIIESNKLHKICKKRFCHESFLFILEVDKYKKKLFMKKKKAEKIYDKFLKPKAKFGINIPSSMRNSVEVKIINGKISNDMFDKCYVHVYNILNDNFST